MAMKKARPRVVKNGTERLNSFSHVSPFPWASEMFGAFLLLPLEMAAAPLSFPT